MAIFLMGIYSVDSEGYERGYHGRLVVDVTSADANRVRRMQRLLQPKVSIMYDATRMGLVYEDDLTPHDPELWDMTEDGSYCELPGRPGLALYAKAVAPNACGAPVALAPLGVDAVEAVWLAGSNYGVHFQFPDGRQTTSISWSSLSPMVTNVRGLRA